MQDTPCNADDGSCCDGNLVNFEEQIEMRKWVVNNQRSVNKSNRFRIKHTFPGVKKGVNDTSDCNDAATGLSFVKPAIRCVVQKVVFECSMNVGVTFNDPRAQVLVSFDNHQVLMECKELEQLSLMIAEIRGCALHFNPC